MQRPCNAGWFAFLAPLLASLVFVLLAAQPDAAKAQEITVIHLPVVSMPGTLVDSVRVRGRLAQEGLPLANATFELRACDDDETLLATGISDEAGVYDVLLPGISGAANVEARLVYPATGTPPLRGTLSSFESICVANHDAIISLPAIELAIADFTSPAKGESVDMPILFTWQARDKPGTDEMYQVVGSILYDCANCAPVAITAAALPHPSSSILLECVYTAHNTVLSGEFRVMVSNDSGVGYSDVYAFNVGRTERC